MGKRDKWIKAFPTPHASKAVDVLAEAWNELASRPKPRFNHETTEPDLTFVLAGYVREVIAVRAKLLGYWTVEDPGGNINYATGEVLKRIRTDIGYHWHDEKEKYSIVFEFKKLDHNEKSRKHYYGESGMQRFVTGAYSIKHPLAFMVGILVEDKALCVQRLKACLQQQAIADLLQMLPQEGKLLRTPPLLFPTRAEFETEHLRDRDKAPKHGTIRISHIFLPFGYPSAIRGERKKRNAVLDSLDE